MTGREYDGKREDSEGESPGERRRGGSSRGRGMSSVSVSSSFCGRQTALLSLTAAPTTTSEANGAPERWISARSESLKYRTSERGRKRRVCKAARGEVSVENKIKETDMMDGMKKRNEPARRDQLVRRREQLAAWGHWHLQVLGRVVCTGGSAVTAGDSRAMAGTGTRQ